MTTWRSMNGVTIDETVVAYPSSQDARDGFEQELKTEGTVVERNAPQSNRAGKVSGDPETIHRAEEIIRLDGDTIHYIKAFSLDDARAFEKSWLRLPF